MNRKRILKRTGRVLSVFLTAALLLGLCPFPGRALELKGQVRAEKSAQALEGPERSFRLDYRVWSGEALNNAAAPCDVILLLDASSSMAAFTGGGGKESGSRLDAMKRGAGSFLEELGQVSPKSRAGVVLFGEQVSSTGPETLDAAGITRLSQALSQAESAGEPDYGAALDRAGELAEQMEIGKGRPLFLITVASGLWQEETGGSTGPLAKLQALRDRGARSYTVLLCGSPEEETEAFWQAMSSAPLSSHHYVCGGEAENCLSAIRRDAASACTVEVRQELDPRFQIPSQEQDRLRRAGAHLTEARDGSFTVSWEADLPRREASPWTASLVIQARGDFPGGNDVPTDGEGTGIYQSGRLTAVLPETTVNVPLGLKLADADARLFLGEKVRGTLDGQNVEKSMGYAPAWYGKGQTGTFSCRWETEDGSPIGSLEQLTELRPEKSVSFRFRVTYRPGSGGLLSPGAPVKETERSALYRVEVVSGTVRIKAAGDVALRRDSVLTFQLKRGDGRVFFRTAAVESDPQSGRLSLEAELGGLPYGVYTVTPVSGGRWTCVESAQLCRLGVWEKDDTVSPDRNRAQVRFTLREPTPWEMGKRAGSW